MPAEAVDASPTPRKRRLPILIGAAGLALVVLGGAAFAVARLWTSPSVNPAERLPNDVVFYLDVNLDPGRDQTSRLLEVLDKFEALDDATDIEGMLSDLLDQLDLDGVDPRRPQRLARHASRCGRLARPGPTKTSPLRSRSPAATTVPRATAWPTFSKPATKISAMSSTMSSRSWR